jgi:meso-butanediol dehydrogenase/(S,S)-butanediol dehydrogenase/diacetyl reductase
MSKVIVITGAALGLGRAVARRLHADGETVVLLGRTLKKVEAVAAELGERASAVECDVGSVESVKKAFAAIQKQHAKIDVLINNAAIYEPFLIADASDAQILNSIAANLAGPILCCRAAIPMMEAGGQIINVGSESVAINPYPHLVMYQSTKSGLDRFTEGLRHELEPSGIRVTNVCAGAMYDAEKQMELADPAAWGRFHVAAKAAGLDLSQRPISNVNSVTGAFRAVIDLPPDVQLSRVDIHARKP